MCKGCLIAPSSKLHTHHLDYACQPPSRSTVLEIIMRTREKKKDWPAILPTCNVTPRRRKRFVVDRFAHRCSQPRVRAEMTAVNDRGVESTKKFEISASRPGLHNVKSILDAELGRKAVTTNGRYEEYKKTVSASRLYVRKPAEG